MLLKLLLLGTLAFAQLADDTHGGRPIKTKTTTIVVNMAWDDFA